MLQQRYYSGYITAHKLRKIYHGRYVMADMLRQLHDGRYITANILRQVYYSRYIKADIVSMAIMLRQIYYVTYIMAYTTDTLRQIYCVPQKRPYLYKCAATEALTCCIRICLLQRIAPRTPLDRFIYKRPPKSKQCLRAPTMEENGSAILPSWPAPISVLDVNIIYDN